jgi:ribosomal protein L2
MVAINFSSRFAPLVEDGTKRQTIRRTARCKVGDRLQIYTGQRTADCRKLINADPVCTFVGYVHLRPDGITVGNVNSHPRDIDEFARADGFRDYADMHAWFAETYGSPFFIGSMIKWHRATEAA